jgi:acyl carrier protein
MNQTGILDLMLEYFEKRNPTMTAESLSEQPVVSLLKDSLDVVEFMIFMEEKLDVESQFDLNQIRAGLVDGKFGDLAREIARLLREQGAAAG